MTPPDSPHNGTLVGFGFGAIQAGLFVYEAFASGNFDRVVLAEIDPETVALLRSDGGRFGLNIAHPAEIESVQVGPVEIENPRDPGDRERLIAALSEASCITTAVPTVNAYRGSGPASLHRLLAAGLRQRGDRPTVIYTAENHRQAAELLEEAVRSELAADADAVLASTCFANTVIAKMSGVIDDAERIKQTSLTPVTTTASRAFLVESFNRILTSHISFAAPGTRAPPGFSVFEEKQDLGPFEETKLFGHNAVHALAAYLAALVGLTRMEELTGLDGGLELVRAALVDEAGAGLKKRWQGKDPLFTESGFREFADDLLTRMFAPSLGDLVQRVARDPARKLAWNDRLVGSLRLALSAAVKTDRLALGVAAALLFERPELREGGAFPRDRLEEIWRPACPDDAEAVTVLEQVDRAFKRLREALGHGRELFLQLRSDS